MGYLPPLAQEVDAGHCCSVLTSGPNTYCFAAMMGPPGTAMKSFVPGTAMRGGTAMQQDPSMARPMTSNRGAGFTSAPNKKFDPLNRSMGSTLGSSTGSALAKKGDATSEEQARDMERKVHELLEESAILGSKGDNNAGEQYCFVAPRAEAAAAAAGSWDTDRVGCIAVSCVRRHIA